MENPTTVRKIRIFFYCVKRTLLVNYFQKYTLKVPARSHFFERYYLNYCLRAQYTIPTNNLCPETCRVMLTKMTPKSKFLLAHLKMAQLVKIPFIVFLSSRLIFTGQTSHFDIVYPRHSSFFRTFYLSRDSYARTVMAL